MFLRGSVVRVKERLRATILLSNLGDAIRCALSADLKMVARPIVWIGLFLTDLYFFQVHETHQFVDEVKVREEARLMAQKFRENVFKAQEIPRSERKERIKKYGHLNTNEKNFEKDTWFRDEGGKPVQKCVAHQFGEK